MTSKWTKNQNSRRTFLKSLVLGVAALISFSTQAQGRKKKEASGEDLPLVQPGVGLAASVNYVHNASDIKDPKLRVERQGVKFENQKCSTCILYSKHGQRNGEEVGKCTLFANELVKASGWCTSWAKKA